jgi:hypothetical protein
MVADDIGPKDGYASTDDGGVALRSPQPLRQPGMPCLFARFSNKNGAFANVVLICTQFDFVRR